MLRTPERGGLGLLSKGVALRVACSDVVEVQERHDGWRKTVVGVRNVGAAGCETDRGGERDHKLRVSHPSRLPVYPSAWERCIGRTRSQCGPSVHALFPQLRPEQWPLHVQGG